LKQSGHHEHPCHAVLLTGASRAGSPRPLGGRRFKDGAAQAPPRTALLISGSEPDPRRVRTGAPDHRVRDDEGTRIRVVPRARQLEGAPHVVLKSQRGQLVAGSHRGRAFAPSVPSERDRAPPSKPTQALLWTCLWTTQPTLIEWGMGVHLNYPLTAQRGIRNSRPDRWGCGNLTLRLAEGRRGRDKKQVVKLYPIASNGPRLGGLTHGYTSLDCTRRRQCQRRVRHRSRLRYCRPRLKHVPRPLTSSRG
jgi:hypothetical protein